MTPTHDAETSAVVVDRCIDAALASARAEYEKRLHDRAVRTIGLLRALHQLSEPGRGGPVRFRIGPF